MVKKFKIGDTVKLDKQGNTGIISDIFRGFAIIGRGSNSVQIGLTSLTKVKRKKEKVN